MHPDDSIHDFWLGYYHAPVQQDEVSAVEVGSGLEYIELITSNGVFFDDGNGEEYFGPGTLFWHFPGDHTVHRYLKDKPYECFVAEFMIPDPHRRIAPRRTFWRSGADMMSFVEESLRAYHDDSFSRSVLSRHIHSRLLWEAYNSGHGATLPGTPAVVGKAIRIMERSFSGPVSVDSLAAELGISVPHLHQLFKRYLGVSPHQWLMTRRLQEAKNRLAMTNTQLKTLAFECGFQNVEHFCRLFKQRFHLTPGEFRLRNTPVYVEDLKLRQFPSVPSNSSLRNS